MSRLIRDVDHASQDCRVPPGPAPAGLDVRMTETISTYLSDPDTWHRVVDAFIRAVVPRLVDRVCDRPKRRPRRRAPRHRADE